MNIYTPWQRTFIDMPFYPGLWIDWAASLLSYIFFHFNFAASIIISALALALYTTADKIAKFTGGKNPKLLSSIPAVLLIIQYARYHHMISESLSILLAATVFYYYSRTKLVAKTKLILFFIITILIYTIFPKGLAVFALLCVTAELIRKNYYNSSALMVLAALSPWLSSLFVFKTDSIETYQRILIFHPGHGFWGNIIANMSVVYWPMMVILCHVAKPAKTAISKRKKIFAAALPTMLVIAAVLVFTDYTSRDKRLIDYYSYTHDWDKLIARAEKISAENYDILICHDVNRALYHRGDLPTRMFDYPQHYESLLLNNKEGFTGGILWLVYPKLGDIYYELADINQSEHYSSEAVELLGYHPNGLKQLAMINIIKEQYTAAGIYLNALRKDWLYRKWAEKYLDKLNNPQLFGLDKNIMEKRNLWVGKNKDLAARYAPQDLFAANPQNKMAFEYIMAFCLLTGQHTAVANSIGYLDKLDYPRGYIPKLYEQAILLYTQMTGQKANLASRQISTESLQTFQQFSQAVSATADMTSQQAGEVLADNFKNTYYYYYHFLRPKK